MLPMAVAVCGCTCVREPDGSWVIVVADPECAHAHSAGQRGETEGDPSRVTGIGECITVVFDRASRTAMLLTTADAPRTIAESTVASSIGSRRS